MRSFVLLALLACALVGVQAQADADADAAAAGELTVSEQTLSSESNYIVSSFYNGESSDPYTSVSFVLPGWSAASGSLADLEQDIREEAAQELHTDIDRLAVDCSLTPQVPASHKIAASGRRLLQDDADSASADVDVAAPAATIGQNVYVEILISPSFGASVPSQQLAQQLIDGVRNHPDTFMHGIARAVSANLATEPPAPVTEVLVLPNGDLKAVPLPLVDSIQQQIPGTTVAPDVDQPQVTIIQNDVPVTVPASKVADILADPTTTTFVAPIEVQPAVPDVVVDTPNGQKLVPAPLVNDLVANNDDITIADPADQPQVNVVVDNVPQTVPASSLPDLIADPDTTVVVAPPADQPLATPTEPADLPTPTPATPAPVIADLPTADTDDNGNFVNNNAALNQVNADNNTPADNGEPAPTNPATPDLDVTPTTNDIKEILVLPGGDQILVPISDVPDVEDKTGGKPAPLDQQPTVVVIEPQGPVDVPASQVSTILDSNPDVTLAPKGEQPADIPVTINQPDGTQTTIPADDVPAALDNGATIAPDIQQPLVTYVDPTDNTLVTVPATQVPDDVTVAPLNQQPPQVVVLVDTPDQPAVPVPLNNLDNFLDNNNGAVVAPADVQPPITVNVNGVDQIVPASDLPTLINDPTTAVTIAPNADQPLAPTFNAVTDPTNPKAEPSFNTEPVNQIFDDVVNPPVIPPTPAEPVTDNTLPTNPTAPISTNTEPAAAGADNSAAVVIVVNVDNTGSADGSSTVHIHRNDVTSWMAAAKLRRANATPAPAQTQALFLSRQVTAAQVVFADKASLAFYQATGLSLWTCLLLLAALALLAVAGYVAYVKRAKPEQEDPYVQIA